MQNRCSIIEPWAFPTGTRHVKHSGHVLSTLVTIWADNPGIRVAEQMELSWICSSSVPNYSEDTFTSFSEGEEETCRQYENDPFESYYSGEESEWPAVTDLRESTWQSSSQNDEEEEPEVLDSTAVREYLSRWICLLKDNRASKQAKSVTEPDNRITEVSEEELIALQSFCAIKINQLCHVSTSTPLKRNKRNYQRHRFTSEKPLTCDLNCTVPEQLMNRLHLKNIKETLKQITDAEMHQPSRCLHCTKKRAELAQDIFLRRRKTLMEEVLLQEKLEECMYTKDALTLIGEIHRSLPKLSEDPKNIWQELNESGLKA
ncbi:uncharacterized protein C8orf48 homolog isoform X3 [Rhineura floridana]|uniref:uncharacterized protein C8orf48 homolog isoform X3 n=1 Tax=Rhineura floridana TaxID=261503 RepID=UPI002AC838BC|nr:uncharacterized protein C8orf48 homolog isoform X3 [Rhineura floridana]